MRTKKCVTCGKVFSTDRTEQAKCDDCLAASRATTLRPRTCRTCGVIFHGGPRAWYCPSCRAERRKTREKKYQLVGYSRHLGDIDTCLICGGEYVICSGRQKYCPKCAPEAVREIDRAQSNAWNKENDYCAKRRENLRSGIKVCVICGREIVPGTPAVTCSPECATARRKENQHRADAKRRNRGKEKSEQNEVEKEAHNMARYQILYSKRGDPLIGWEKTPTEALARVHMLEAAGYNVDIWEHTEAGARELTTAKLVEAAST